MVKCELTTCKKQQVSSSCGAKAKKQKHKKKQMAIYHLSTKPISRSSGRSATASIAYRAGVEMTDERTGVKHDYSNRGGVVMSKCFVYDKDDFKPVDRNKLWNNAELIEKRKDARTAREIVVNLPHELSEKDREKLVDNFAKDFAKSYGVAVDYAIHTPDKEGDQRNHHAHIMVTTRAVSLDEDNTPKLGDKTNLELSNTKLKELGKATSQAQIKKIRARWSERANNALEMAGREERIDHRSHKDRGLDIKPTIKLGWEQSKLEKQGIRTPRGDINRQIRADNAHIIALQSEIRILKTQKQPLETQISPTEPQNPLERTKPNKAPKNANMSQLGGKKVVSDYSIEDKKQILDNFKALCEQKAEELHQLELKDIRETAKPMLDDINKHRDNKPLNPLKTKEWQKQLDEKIARYNKIKQAHDTKKTEGRTDKHLQAVYTKAYQVNLSQYEQIQKFKEDVKQHEAQLKKAQSSPKIKLPTKNQDRGR